MTITDINKIINNTYRKYGFQVATDHIVAGGVDSFKILLNTEKPFLGKDFFNLIYDINEEIEALGYLKKDSGFCYDFYHITYVVNPSQTS